MNSIDKALNQYKKRKIRHLYKYVKFDEDLIKSLIYSELWFSNPEGFNDPYDCKIDFNTEASQEDLEFYFHEQNKRLSWTILQSPKNKQVELLLGLRYPNEMLPHIINHLENGGFLRTEEEITEQARTYSNDRNLLETTAVKSRNDANKELRVLCLTKNSNNILMWAHYANNHTGVRIKLDVYQDIGFFSDPVFVDYQRQTPEYKIFKTTYNPIEMFEFVVGTKSKDWQYEKEVRIIKSNKLEVFKKGGLLKFNRLALKEITFGIWAREEDIELAKEINCNYFDNMLIISRAGKEGNSFKPAMTPA
jgi:hypothetical protein